MSESEATAPQGLQDLHRAIEQAEHKPGQWARAWHELGGICDPDPAVPLSLSPFANVPKPWGHFSYKRDAWLAVAAVNALPALMADDLLREVAIFLGSLPQDLGKGSLNGLRAQLRNKLAARGI
jgi:hypothetical protein